MLVNSSESGRPHEEAAVERFRRHAPVSFPAQAASATHSLHEDICVNRIVKYVVLPLWLPSLRLMFYWAYPGYSMWYFIFFFVILNNKSILWLYHIMFILQKLVTLAYILKILEH